MREILLYTQSTNSYTLPIVWVAGGLVLVLLVVLIIRQHHTWKKLKAELSQLAKTRQDSIEYEFILRAMKIATWHANPKTRLLSYDADFREGKDSYTTTPETPIDQMWDYIDQSDSERVKAAMESLLSGQANSYHQTYRVKVGNSGMTYWEESYAIIAARDEDGMPTKIVGTSLRVDERKSMEMALIDARNKAEESDRLKTAFLANMSHEIRTPLNAIVGFSDLLPMVQSEEDRNQLINEIRNNNHKLLHIIDGLVSMSEVEARAKHLVKSQVDIVPLIDSVSEYVVPLLDPQKVVLIKQFPYPTQLITTDEEKLSESLKALLDNAVKFTEQGSITLGYSLTENNHIRIFVSDTGVGIAPEDQEHIFDRFFKVDEYVPGTGIGLSVAKSHVDSMGGTLGVDSELHKGSTFWIDLPLA